MKSTRSTLLTPIALVASVAVGLALIRHATEASAHVVFNATLALLLAASLRAYLAPPAAWCFGFALFGWVHLTLSQGNGMHSLPTILLVGEPIWRAMGRWAPFAETGRLSEAQRNANFAYGNASAGTLRCVLSLWFALVGAWITQAVATVPERRGRGRNRLRERTDGPMLRPTHGR